MPSWIPGSRGQRRGAPNATINQEESRFARREMHELKRRVPFLSGQEVLDVEFTATDVTNGYKDIEHLLGRKIRGWYPMRDDAPPVWVEAHRSTILSLATGDTTMVWEVEDDDWRGAYNTSTGQFTAPHTGLYELTPAIFVTGVVDGKRFLVRTAIGGSQVRLNDSKIASNTGSTNLALGRTQRMQLTAAQVVTFIVNNGDTVARDTPTNSDQDYLTIRSDDSPPTEDSTNNPDDTKYLRLCSPRTRTMDLWVW